jgi:hypothetical protein
MDVIDQVDHEPSDPDVSQGRRVAFADQACGSPGFLSKLLNILLLASAKEVNDWL